jgi:predicted dehydrogenase
MNKTINVGIIGCQVWQSAYGTMENFHVTKILITEKSDSLKSAYPEAEIVHDVKAIADDSAIELVIVSPSHFISVRPVIEAGKSVRVMNS